MGYPGRVMLEGLTCKDFPTANSFKEKVKFLLDEAGIKAQYSITITNQGPKVDVWTDAEDREKALQILKEKVK